MGINTATVLSATRRSVKLLTEDGVKKAIASSSARELCVGDQVNFEDKTHELFITSLKDRKNCLRRSYQEVVKLIASNLDRLFLVSSVEPPMQALSIDRMMAAAHAERIPVSLVINKSDLDVESLGHMIAVYESVGVPIVRTSAKFGTGLDALEQILDDPTLKIVALAGTSGVGKSTILNRLVPDAARKTGEISRSGQGRQTTTQSAAYIYHPKSRASPLLIIDLPGIQNFGVSHLSEDEIAHAFPEIMKLRDKCEYGSCAHDAELDCGVKAGVDSGEMDKSRYISYLDMLHELKNARKW